MPLLLLIWLQLVLLYLVGLQLDYSQKRLIPALIISILLLLLGEALTQQIICHTAYMFFLSVDLAYLFHRGRHRQVIE